MKKFIQTSILLLLFSSIVFIACKKTETGNVAIESEKAYSLKAPNGIQISNNTTELKSLIASSVNRKFKTDNLEYDISNIKYTVTKSGGVISDIEYKTKNGIVTNVILMFDVEEKIVSKGDVRVVIEDEYIKNHPSSETAMFRVRKYACSGPECCKVHALEHPDGSVDVDCSCPGCTMTIE
jgi:hypothetical protein